MSRHNHLLHFHISKKKKLNYFDKFVVVASFAYPFSGVPQVLEVFNGHIDGVSLASWVGFIFFSLIFFFYGLVHKIKPMIITNALWLLVDGLIVVGIVYHSAS